MSTSPRWIARTSRGVAQVELPSTVRYTLQKRWATGPPQRSRQHGQNIVLFKPSRQQHRAASQQSDHSEQPKGKSPAASAGRNTSSQVPQEPPVAQDPEPGRNTQLSTALANANSADLVADVLIPDDPLGVLPPDHPALALLGNSSLVIQRQIEMMNIMLGFEQANRYIIMNGSGETIGYIAERDHGIGSAVTRQLFRTHRSFTTHIFDRNEREVLRIHRPFAYINSRIRIYDPVPEGGYEAMESSTGLQRTSVSSRAAQISPLKLEDMRIIGESKQQWAPLRRKYNLFTFRPLDAEPVDKIAPRIESGERATSDTMALTESKVPDQAIEAGMSQFAHVNEPFLSWDFGLKDESSNTIGSVNRNFSGFAREIFSDTGVYALRMDSAAQSSVLESPDGKPLEQYEREATAMTLDQRAVMLATAVSIDFDYFSRHSGAGGGFMPMWFPMGGGAAEGGAGGAAAGGAAGGAVEGGVGGAVEGAAGAAGTVGRAGAVGAEGAMAGAGTMAGYEAMQRGAYGGADNAANDPTFDPDGQSPQAPQGTYGDEQPPDSGADHGDGGGNEWWNSGGDDGPAPPSAGGEGGGGWADSISDFFGD